MPPGSSPKVPHEQLYKLPITQRPPHGFLFAKIFFPLVFNFGQLGINSAQFLALPLLLVPVVGRKWFDAVIGYTKDGYGRLLILITVLFAPTSIVITTDQPPELAGLVERDPSAGEMTRINLPDRLVIMGNHQAYLDWMYLWIVSCYAGHSRGLTILLKASLKHVPVVGWGMQFFRFIFLQRSWASDRANLTRSLTRLGRRARGGNEVPDGQTTTKLPADSDESTGLLSSIGKNMQRSPLWLLIFPEGTITSDEERAKSLKYAKREGVDDFVTLLHPRSTGLLFCLRTLLPQVPDLQLLDVTIGYPGVPLGKYPQEWYGLFSTFFSSVPPPQVHMHLHLYSNLASPSSEIPSLTSPPLADQTTDGQGKVELPADTGLATPEEAKKFELWLRGVWIEKEERMKRFAEKQKFESAEGGEQAREIVRIRQVKWYDHIAAFGAGGLGTAAVLGVAIWQIVEAIER